MASGEDGSALQFIDTHCHIQSSDQHTGPAGEASTRRLWDKAGFPSASDLIGRAGDAGVTQMICVGCDLPDSQLAVDFVQDRPQCVASIGIHPHEANRYAHDSPEVLEQLQQFAVLASGAKVVAIGECGLDYYYAHSEPAEQATILRFQIELALEHDLPMIFHVREAFDDFWPIFDAYNDSQRTVRGVLHSFTDSSTNMEQAVARGLYIGVNGIATFTKSSEQRETYKNIPMSSILLETDAPFLTPSPYRGNICEPYHTSVTAEFLAHLRHEPLDELATATSANARKLFQI